MIKTIIDVAFKANELIKKSLENEHQINLPVTLRNKRLKETVNEIEICNLCDYEVQNICLQIISLSSEDCYWEEANSIEPSIFKIPYLLAHETIATTIMYAPFKSDLVEFSISWIDKEGYEHLHQQSLWMYSICDFFS